MSKLMSVLGIVLLAIGAALALVGLVNPAQMQVYGLTIDTAAILLTGGILSIGLGGVIAALQDYTPSRAMAPVAEVAEEAAAETLPPVIKIETAKVEVPVVEEPAAPVEEPQQRVRFNPFARKTTTALAAAAAAAHATAPEPAAAAVVPAKNAVDDTIAALEQAKADIANAIGGVASMTEERLEHAMDPAVEEVVEAEEVEDVDADAAEDEAEGADGELYVVEEREIRGRPARILSDSTVEAETDEGWMRFENLEHLNEYLDAMGEPA